MLCVIRLIQNQNESVNIINGMVTLPTKIILWYSLLQDFDLRCCAPIQWRSVHRESITYSKHQNSYNVQGRQAGAEVATKYKRQRQALRSLRKEKSKLDKSQPGTLSDKVTHVIDFTAEPVVQFDVPVVKNTFVDDGDMQLIANKL